MLFFGVCYFLYFIKLSAGKGFWVNQWFLQSSYTIEFGNSLLVRANLRTCAAY